jgi:hypothetical protein
MTREAALFLAERRPRVAESTPAGSFAKRLALAQTLRPIWRIESMPRRRLGPGRG